MNYTASLAFFVPIIISVLTVVLVITLRWFSHKERMALINKGLSPENELKNKQNHKIILAIGLVIGLGGLALTIGLITLGVGPWLLAGLLPLFIGLSFVLVSMVLAPPKPKKTKEEPTIPEECEEADVVEEQEVI